MTTSSTLRNLFAIIILTSPLSMSAQIGPVHFIDSTLASTGASCLQYVDVNDDNHADVLAAFTGSQGKTGYYPGDGSGGFSAYVPIDSIGFMAGVASGDFNLDGLTDVVTIGGITFDVNLYLNTSDGFDSAISIDTGLPTILNDLVVADFDQNGSDDIVVIGQHTIDFYRNLDGSGFQKEHILTTANSPEVLECLDLATADMNGDGIPDLVAGETAGLVIYINDGNAAFTPHYYSGVPTIVPLIHPFDMDQDGDMDVVLKESSNAVKWFSNDGSGVMSFESQLMQMPTLHNFISLDANGDGMDDIFATYFQNASVFLNDTDHSFQSEISVYQDDNLYMDALCIGDSNGDGTEDLFWAGLSRSIAYHPNTSTTDVVLRADTAPFMVYPNPASQFVFITSEGASHTEVSVLSISGKVVARASDIASGRMDISGLAPGLYFVVATNGSKSAVKKLMVE